MRRPFGIQLLAALLTFYAMSGVLLALSAATARAPGLRWPLVTAAGALFALSTGAAALAVWRLERRAPVLLRVCGLVGLGACLALPLALGGAAGDARPVWRAAVAGGVLFLLFLLLVARYVRRQVR